MCPPASPPTVAAADLNFELVGARTGLGPRWDLGLNVGLLVTDRERSWLVIIDRCGGLGVDHAREIVLRVKAGDE